MMLHGSCEPIDKCMKGVNMVNAIKRILGWGGCALLLLAILCLQINMTVLVRSDKYIILPQEAAQLDSFDCILVLGAKVYDSGQLSGVLQDRTDTGLLLYQDDISPKILFSGDHGREEYDEVNALKAYALQNGVPNDDIFLDHAGFSTYESMVRARDVFDASRILIVTQQYHLSRSVYDARALGLDAYGIASDIRTYPGQRYFEFREFFARVKDFFYVSVLLPPPTYLGEKISLSGSGEQTHD